MPHAAQVRYPRRVRAQRRNEFLQNQIAAQRRWIEEHGGDLAGYIVRYGEADDPNRHGDGGAAIYKADTDELRRLEGML